MTPLTPRLLLSIAALLLCTSHIFAQPAPSAPAAGKAATPAAAPRAQNNIVSPEVGADRRITFRMVAPNATKVSVTGQWDYKTYDMTKNDQGVWSVTVGPIEPSYWIYNFIVDGVAIADPVNPDVKLRMRTSASQVMVPAPTPALWEARSDIPHGAVDINWHNSKVTKDTRNFHVYTPPDYTPNGSNRYPVLYLLHGNNGTPADWTAAGRANFMADALIAAKKMQPRIIVMPSGHAVPFGGPQAENSATFERYVIEELIPAVEAKYRVAPGTANRAIMGLSMGGGQALRVGLGHLDLFGAVGGYSPATIADFETRFKTLLDDPAGTNSKLKLLWIGCGKQDSLYGFSQRADGILTKAGIKHTFLDTDGAHDYRFWRRCLEETATKLFR
jgi:enterochelin esterase family protein